MTPEEVAKRATLVLGEIPGVEFESYVDMLFWLTKLNLLEDIYKYRDEGVVYLTGKERNVWYMIGLDMASDGSIIQGKGMILLPLNVRQQVLAESIVRSYLDAVKESYDTH